MTKPEKIMVPVEKIRYGLRRYNRIPEAIEKHKRWPFYLRVKESIEKNGLINPIIVVDNGDGFYTIVFGNNRFIALQELGHAEVPIVIKPPDISAKDFKHLVQTPTEVDVIKQGELGFLK